MGGGPELSAYFIGGLLKCVLYACKGGGGVKKGRKTACILYQWPQKQIGGIIDEPYVGPITETSVTGDPVFPITAGVTTNSTLIYLMSGLTLELSTLQ